jgi:hypothetical protein
MQLGTGESRMRIIRACVAGESEELTHGWELATPHSSMKECRARTVSWA